MSALGLVFQFLLTYVVLGNILALFCLRLLRNLSIDRPSVLFASLGLAPGIVSLILYFSFLLLPGFASIVYIGIVLAIFLALLAFSWRDFPLLLETYKSLFTKPRYRSFTFLVKAAVAVIILGAVVLVSYQAILFPIQACDALRHASRGPMFFQDCSLEHFPLTSPLENGFFLNVLYPPGVHLLYAWSYLLQGSTASDIGVRMVAPMYAVFTLLLVWRWGESLRKGAGLFAVFALATMPLYLNQAAGNSIDAMRIFFFFSSLYWVYQLTRHRSLALLGIAVVALALASFIHTIGVLALPVAGLLYLLFAGERPLIRRIGTGTLLVSLAGVLGGFEYLRRFIFFGSWRGPRLHFSHDMSEVLANRGLDTTYDIVVNGVFRIFTNPHSYNIVAWLFLASLLLLLYKQYRGNRAFVFVILCSAFTAVLIWVLPSPATPGWANGRYIMTIAPFLALGAGLFLVTLKQMCEYAFDYSLRKLGKPPGWVPSSRTLIFGFAGAALASLAISAVLSPAFVATHLSPDHLLEPATIQKVYLVRGLAGLLGVLSLIASVLVWKPGRRTLIFGFAGAALALLATSAVLSPAFVATHLSPDHLLEPATILKVYLVRGFAGLLGILSLIAGLVAAWPFGGFILRQRDRLVSFPFRYRDWLRHLGPVVLRQLPLLILIVVMCFIGADNLAWAKTGRASTSYGLEIVCLSDEEKLLSTGGYFDASICYINDNTPEGSLVLVTEDPAYFYRAERPGIYYRDLRMGPFYEADSAEDAYKFLLSMGIDYLQVSGRSMQQTLFQNSYFEDILLNPEMCTLIWGDFSDGGSTLVFQLKRPQ